MNATIEIGGRAVGAGAPCLVIAEAGVNHNGDLAIAHRLVDAAADAGADAVKFQTFTPELLASEAAKSAAYQRHNAGAADQRSMLAGLALPAPAWSELRAHAGDRGLVFLSTAFDRPSAELLVELGVPALKVPSGELDNLPFVRELAAYGLPLVISTGMATEDEVIAAQDAAAPAPATAFLHCVTSYPAPLQECNLRAIPALRERLGVPVGWSDHTIGATSAVGAVALGASLLEKHLTLSRSMEGPDHRASEEPDQLAAYVGAVRELEAALGDGRKRPMPSELDHRVLVRRSLHAARDLAAGTRIAPGDVIALRPAEGMAPDAAVAGRSLVRDVAAGAPVREEDLG